MQQEPLLEVNGLTMKFGNLMANDDVSFSVYPGEIVGLIGPNGAGKTTCFNCVTGFLQPTSGRVTFAGVDITRRPPYEVARLGLVRTFQIVHTFRDMTVFENVLTAAFLKARSAKEAAEFAHRSLELTGLTGLADKQAGGLTIADKKRLEIARALATQPRLVMLDETMAGLNRTEIREAMDLCLLLKQTGITLVVVEHIMEALMPISDRVVVSIPPQDHGRNASRGGLR